MALYLFVLGSVCLFAAVIALVLWRKPRSQNAPSRNISSAPEGFNNSSEVVVVGSGILGSAIGAVLARDGRKVTIIERDLSEPDRIVGEVLQPGGVLALKKLGLEGAVEGIDCHTVRGYVVHDDQSGTSVHLSYPNDEHGEMLTGRSFHHGRFVMGLRKQASKEPNVSMVEGTVTSLMEDDKGNIVGVEYKDKVSGEKKTVQADLTVVADGCFSKFRKELVSSPVSVSSQFIGLVMHNVPQYSPGHAELVLTSSGPILVYQISSTCTRILVDISSKPNTDLKEYIRTTVLPQLPSYMQQQFRDALESSGLRSMPNSFLPPAPVHRPGVVILGDAMNMRHPLTGAGMTVALKDVTILREMLQDIPSLQQRARVQQAFRSFQWKRKISHSFVINVLAQALYAVFAAREGYMRYMKEACFEYFKLGGLAVSGPVGLLSVTRPHPLILIGHFFAVACFAMYRTVRKNIPFRPDQALLHPIMILMNASRVILSLILSELQSFVK